MLHLILSEAATETPAASAPSVFPMIITLGLSVVLLFVLYFMLIGGTRMENYCRAMLPFNATVARNVTNEIYMIVRSNAIGIPLIAVVQVVLLVRFLNLQDIRISVPKH